MSACTDSLVSSSAPYSHSRPMRYFEGAYHAQQKKAPVSGGTEAKQSRLARRRACNLLHGSGYVDH
eukprot:5227002-Amphidinium_carterae.1